jgi:hypothetical protein
LLFTLVKPSLSVPFFWMVFVVAGWALLKDSYDDRPGREQPWWMRPFRCKQPTSRNSSARSYLLMS